MTDNQRVDMLEWWICNLLVGKTVSCINGEKVKILRIQGLWLITESGDFKLSDVLEIID